MGQDVDLPKEAVANIRRIPGVQHVGSLGAIEGVNIYRNDQIEASRTGGLEAAVADGDLLAATGAKLLHGSWFNAATEKLPATVLGRTTAERLGIQRAGSLVWLGGQQFTVVGILDSSPLAPELDSMALVGEPAARKLLGYTGTPTLVFERSTEDRVAAVRELLPPTINPQAPSSVKVSRPSDALAAKNTVDQAFTGLLVGVGSIALLVGGIGVANTMVISVLERRWRSACGARSARRAGTSACSSSSRRCCSRPWAGWRARCWDGWSPRSRHGPTAGPWRSRRPC